MGSYATAVTGGGFELTFGGPLHMAAQLETHRREHLVREVFLPARGEATAG